MKSNKPLFYRMMANACVFIFAMQISAFAPNWQFFVTVSPSIISASINSLFAPVNSALILASGIILGFLNWKIPSLQAFIRTPNNNPYNNLTYLTFSFGLNTLTVLLSSLLIPGFLLSEPRVILTLSVLLTLANWGFSKLDI